MEIELTSLAKEPAERFETALVAYDEIVEARRMFGSNPDHQALVAVADLPTYERLLIKELMALPGLNRLEAPFAMKTIKTDAPHGPPAGRSRGVRT